MSTPNIYAIFTRYFVNFHSLFLYNPSENLYPNFDASVPSPGYKNDDPELHKDLKRIFPAFKRDIC